MHMLLTQPGGLRDRGIVDEAAAFSCYMAAIIHDFQHQGVQLPMNDALYVFSMTLECLHMHSYTWLLISSRPQAPEAKAILAPASMQFQPAP